MEISQQKVLVENCFLKTSAIERLFGKLNGNFYDFYLHWHLGRYLHKISEECPFCWNQIIRKQVLFLWRSGPATSSEQVNYQLWKYILCILYTDMILYLKVWHLNCVKKCNKIVQISYTLQCLISWFAQRKRLHIVWKIPTVNLQRLKERSHTRT